MNVIKFLAVLMKHATIMMEGSTVLVNNIIIELMINVYFKNELLMNYNSNFYSKIWIVQY